MVWVVTTEGERIFQCGIVLVKYGKSFPYNIGLFAVAFRTESRGQVLVFFYLHLIQSR